MNKNLYRKWNKRMEDWMKGKPFLYALVFAIFLTLVNWIFNFQDSSFLEVLISFVFFYIVGIGSAYFFRYLLKKFPQ